LVGSVVLLPRDGKLLVEDIEGAVEATVSVFISGEERVR
jgi:hypothetical protein